MGEGVSLADLEPPEWTTIPIELMTVILVNLNIGFGSSYDLESVVPVTRPARMLVSSRKTRNRDVGNSETNNLG